MRSSLSTCLGRHVYACGCKCDVIYPDKRKSPLQMHICKGLDVSLVPRTGLEPVHREVLVFETNASTNSAIWASDCLSYVNMKPPLVSLSVCKVNIFFLIGKII